MASSILRKASPHFGLAAILLLPWAAAAAEFNPERRGRIAFVGGRQLEGQVEQGYLESLLTAAFPDRRLSFRNLAWAGDTVDQRSRPKPFPGLFEWIDRIDPDHVFVSYGSMEALRGKKALGSFIGAYKKLLTKLENRDLGVVVVSPTPQTAPPEPRGEKGGGVEGRNRLIGLYTDAIAKLARKRGHPFVNLFDALRKETSAAGKGPSLTTNGVYLSKWGYWRAAVETASALGIDLPDWRVAVTAGGEVRKAKGTRIEGVERPDDAVLRFYAKDRRLPVPPAPRMAEQRRAQPRRLRITGLEEEGRYLLRVDGEPVARARANQWAEGVSLVRDTAFDAVERLRDRVIEKNRQFFYRYRPQNHVHVYGVRKDKYLDREVRQFGAVVRRRERKLQRLARPVERTYELLHAREPRATLREVERVTLARNQPRPRVEADKVPSAEEVQSTFKLADGYEANLFADLSTLRGKPIQMRFDPSGRLWVSVTQRYPLIKPGQVATDRILVLEDTDGDGRADTKRVFADHLLIPTGLQPGDGGVYAYYDTRIVHLKDTNGDGRADRQRVVAAGIGTEDTHHMCHSFRLSPWGRLYFHQGIFQNTRIETPYGLVKQAGHRTSAGCIEVDPQTGRVRRHAARSHTANPWGHAMNRWGWSFQMGTNPPAVTMLILPTADGTASTVPLPGDNQTRPMNMDAEIVGGTHLPKKGRGNLLSTFQRGIYPENKRRGESWYNRVLRWKLKDRGSGYALEKRPPLIASDHPWFRPTQIRQGPDGAFYVADFVTPVIDHGRIHQRSPGRDYRHGRIWRIEHTDRSLLDPPNLQEVPVERAIRSLASEERWVRRQAQRTLAGRPTSEVLDPLLAEGEAGG